MYHEHGIRQPQIAEQLHISQPRVSRLLKQAVELGIVRTSVVTPAGVHAELEEQIQRRYGLRDVVVADVDTDTASPQEQSLLRAIGSAAAVYLETTLTGGDRIGISSWSSTVLATVDTMRPRPTPVAQQVVQMIGGVGNSRSQVYATRLADRLALLTGAEAVFLPAPGLAASAAARDALLADPHISAVFATYHNLTMVLAGVGSLEPSPLLVESGNAIADADQSDLRRLGAVGDICLRFFDEHGNLVPSALDERVLGIDADTLRSIPRVVALAGGSRKYTAIRAALLGGWIDVLITDLDVARRLAAEPAPAD
ncbi:MAG TPA: sugar-binding domain-containing protein [Micromonosporaceae bacterium]|nr:sugar-binding domain-containing protein [Micromonosporaceae bacterium]